MPRPLDTDTAAWSVQNAALDRMGGEARLRVALELSDAVREIRIAGLRHAQPEWSRHECIAQIVWEEYGVELPARR